MGYAVSDSIVRVSRFKPSGKWYDDLAIDMDGWYNEPFIHDALKGALIEAGNDLGYYTYVCLEPFYHSAFPIMIRGEA